MATPIDIFSDPICPWCWIGWNRLERARARQAAAGAAAPLAISWRPFQLNPDMPEEGMDRRAYLERKFGGPEGAARVYDHIAETAAADGLDMRFERISRTPNTLNAHRLLLWAQRSEATADDGDGAQQRAETRSVAVALGLFRRYFQEGEDISDPAVLRATAEEAGLDGDRIAQDLASDTDRAAIKEADAAARGAGLSGAPTFIVNRRHVVPGALDVDTWSRVLTDIATLDTGA